MTFCEKAVEWQPHLADISERIIITPLYWLCFNQGLCLYTPKDFPINCHFPWVSWMFYMSNKPYVSPLSWISLINHTSTMGTSSPEIQLMKEERNKINFNVEEVTNFLDGGTEKTALRRKIGTLDLVGEFFFFCWAISILLQLAWFRMIQLLGTWIAKVLKRVTEKDCVGHCEFEKWNLIILIHLYFGQFIRKCIILDG